MEKNNHLFETRNLHSNQPGSEKIWVGECKVCKKMTSCTCPRCQSQFYCTTDHYKKNRKDHKKECKEKLKIKQEWKKKKQLDLEQDVLKVAAELFTCTYVSPDQKMGTWCMLPVQILNDEGKKAYVVQVFDPKDPKLILEDYKKRGFTKEMFYEIYSLSKAPLYHNAIILAMRELIIAYHAEIKFAANVNVVSDFTPIELIYADDKKPRTEWKKECLNTGHHKTLMINTKNMGRILIDFTAPQYGIIQYNVSNTTFPIWICPEEKQKAYKVTEKIIPTDIESTITQMISHPEKFGNELDFFPLAVISYKNSLIQRIMEKKSWDKQQASYPPSAKFVSIQEAIDNGWA